MRSPIILRFFLTSSRSKPVSPAVRSVAPLSARKRSESCVPKSEATKKGASVTAAQIEKKLAQFDGYPEEGSIGESISQLRPLLAKKRKDEEAKAKAIAAQKAKEAAAKAKKERAEQQAKEDAEFWAAHEQALLAEQARQDQLWAEAAMPRAATMVLARWPAGESALRVRRLESIHSIGFGGAAHGPRPGSQSDHLH